MDSDELIAAIERLLTGTGGAPPSRAVSDRIAAALATGAGLRAVRAAQAAGTLGSRPAGATEAGSATGRRTGPRPISIWRPSDRDGALVFERPPPLPVGDHYAPRRVLSAAKAPGRRRVCFLGESAAAGYLCAPHLTPAMLLERNLNWIGGEGAWDVIDLARTNERLATLVDTVRGSLQLAPDALVVFAGNNWELLELPERSPYYPSVRGRQRCGRRLREGGLEGVVEAGARAGLEHAAGALQEILRQAAAAGVPLVLTVPEVNLADWYERQPPPWLPGADLRRWYRLEREAEGKLAAGEPESAAAVALQLLDLDRGLCPTGYRLLARAWQAQGRDADAAAACRAEVASTHYATLSFLGAPRATPAAQELIRRSAADGGCTLVDLPAIFAAYAGTPLTDRRLFLDYCHLTPEAMGLAAAALAAGVLAATGSAEEATDWRVLANKLPPAELRPPAAATACLGAAVHTAHRLPAGAGRDELLAHWCDRALAVDPSVAGAMRDLLDARSAPVPALLTAAQATNFGSPHRLSHQHGWRYDHLDAALVTALVAAFGRAGRDCAETVGRRFAAGHGPRDGPVDLLAPRFLAEPIERSFPELTGESSVRAYYRALLPVSAFVFCADGADALEFEFVLRASGAQIPGARARVGVSVAGRRLASIPLESRWRRHRRRLPAGVLQSGMHRLELDWKVPLADAGSALAAVAERLELGLGAELRPVFGELHTLTVRRSSGP